MNCNTNNQAKFMNRAERRKNKIKTKKMPECKYTKEELKAFFEKELRDLRRETCSEALRRERYKKLQKLMEEYEKQNGKSKGKSENRNLENSQDERVRAYVKERAGLATNRVYQNLHSSNTTGRTQNQQITKNRRMREAIQAYEMQQVAYTMRRSAQDTKKAQTTSTAKNTAKSSKKATKKGFFAKILDLFKPQKSTNTAPTKPNIAGVKTASKPVRYYDRIVQQSKQITKNVYNDFEKALRDRQNYSKEINCTTVINGRKVNLEPRCL